VARDIIDPANPAEQEARRARANGEERPGRVFLRDFDQGLVETMGACIIPSAPIPDNQRYWLNVEGVDPPPGKPGIVVTFSFPEAEFKSMVLPMVLIRRDDISPANERWQSRHITYRTPAKGANKCVVPEGNGALSGLQGFDQMEQGFQAIPYDITYTISILSHYRGAVGQRGAVQLIFEYLLTRFSPYSVVHVIDDEGDPRGYHAFMEATSVLDEHPTVGERIIGFGVTLRVEAELDHTTVEIVRTVTRPLTLNLKKL
jgi:hypothetical protein